MNRIFGKAKEKAPTPDMTAVIKGVNNNIMHFTIFWNIEIQRLKLFKGR